ncbi:unnamed protein product [Diabrotica balteata]|uniref:Uncharacterized protein n=1 Tax=Diabrotica balteata TaxID=107213 RepID=A0A9N9X6L4_DIABA|nr:unnamed protein product [Diabrotica balteata]
MCFLTTESPSALLQTKEDTNCLVNGTKTEIIYEVDRTTKPRKNKNRQRGNKPNERDKEKHSMGAVCEGYTNDFVKTGLMAVIKKGSCGDKVKKYRGGCRKQSNREIIKGHIESVKPSVSH